MCKIDFSTTFLNKSFPHWLYDVLFVYGDIVYAIVSFLQDERNNTCFTRRHRVSTFIVRIPPCLLVFYEETRWNPNDERGKHSNIFHPDL